MVSLFQSLGFRLLAAAGIFIVLWTVVGLVPAYIQHKMVDELVVEASEQVQLRNAPPAKTFAWLHKRFRRDDIRELLAKDIVQVKGIGSHRVISYNYEVKKTIFRNISYVVTFNGQS